MLTELLLHCCARNLEHVLLRLTETRRGEGRWPRPAEPCGVSPRRSHRRDQAPPGRAVEGWSGHVSAHFFVLLQMILQISCTNLLS